MALKVFSSVAKFRDGNNQLSKRALFAYLVDVSCLSLARNEPNNDADGDDL